MLRHIACGSMRGHFQVSERELKSILVKSKISDECLSWCDIKEECFEMDRLYRDGSHKYLRGCWVPGSDDAIKQTGCVTVNAEVAST